ncbi:hypothetical protein [Massilia sp. PWRC2]|uniref:hypothetical protein n=1 Tax=Massilia sp. PWRC2 TaxID=2804626 RepID=UPI003CE9FDC2
MKYFCVCCALMATLWASSASAQAPLRGFLRPGQILVGSSDQELVAGETRFVMQHDCNLVVYHGRQAVWATNTNNKGSACAAIMQGDGNLVLTTGNGRVLWSSHTDKHPGAWLLAQTDGNVVIYRPGDAVSGRSLWATNTNVRHRTAASPGSRSPRFPGCAFFRTDMT